MWIRVSFQMMKYVLQILLLFSLYLALPLWFGGEFCCSKLILSQESHHQFFFPRHRVNVLFSVHFTSLSLTFPYFCSSFRAFSLSLSAISTCLLIWWWDVYFIASVFLMRMFSTKILIQRTPPPLHHLTI